MKAAIQALEEKISQLEEWNQNISESIHQWQKEMDGMEAQRSLNYKEIETINEAIWSLQNATK